MKKNFVISIIVIISCIVFYFILDQRLYYYGKSSFNFYHPLPLKIKPVFRHDFEGGFYLEDQHGFALISTGDYQYVGSSLKLAVKEILMYGYTDAKLIVLVKDTSGKKYFIEYIRNNNLSSKRDMIINIFESKTFIISKEEYTWVNVENDSFKRVELLRNYLVVVIIISFLISIYFAKRAKH